MCLKLADDLKTFLPVVFHTSVYGKSIFLGPKSYLILDSPLSLIPIFNLLQIHNFTFKEHPDSACFSPTLWLSSCSKPPLSGLSYYNNLLASLPSSSLGSTPTVFYNTAARLILVKCKSNHVPCILNGSPFSSEKKPESLNGTPDPECSGPAYFHALPLLAPLQSHWPLWSFLNPLGMPLRSLNLLFPLPGLLPHHCSHMIVDRDGPFWTIPSSCTAIWFAPLLTSFSQRNIDLKPFNGSFLRVKPKLGLQVLEQSNCFSFLQAHLPPLFSLFTRPRHCSILIAFWRHQALCYPCLALFSIYFSLTSSNSSSRFQSPCHFFRNAPLHLPLPSIFHLSL